MQEILHKYTNGGFAIEIHRDGTKIREQINSSPAIMPEQMDLKITNWCDAGCGWCHENSTTAGKHADFVVWNGDPLSNFTRCEQTWVDGRRYFSRDEDQQMRQEATRRRNVLIQKVLASGEEARDSSQANDDPAALWPRFDEYCAHFRHQAALQQQRDRQQQDVQQQQQSAQ